VEDVVGQGSAVVENKIKLFQTCLLQRTEEMNWQYAYFGNTFPDGKED
jgi:hypothetical protein